jgi:hypothetical protein
MNGQSKDTIMAEIDRPRISLHLARTLSSINWVIPLPLINHPIIAVVKDAPGARSMTTRVKIGHFQIAPIEEKRNTDIMVNTPQREAIPIALTEEIDTTTQMRGTLIWALTIVVMIMPQMATTEDKTHGVKIIEGVGLK